MKRRSALSLSFLLCIHTMACEENLPPKVSVDFINRTGATITVLDNSGSSMFQDVIVKPYQLKNLTYECQGGGSCNLRFEHKFSGDYDVCICSDSYQHNERYSFGYQPSNEAVNDDEKCNYCRN